MSQISLPLRIILVAVIGLCVAFMLFLRPKTEDTAAPAAPAAAVTSSPAKDSSVQTYSKPSAILQRAAGDPAAGTGVNTNPVTQAPATSQSQPAKLSKKQLAALPSDVRRAVAHRKVLALLFYNNRSDDDIATRRALRHVDSFGG